MKSSKTISLSRNRFRKSNVRTVGLKITQKTKLHRVFAVQFCFSLQSLHPRQGWECSNCSEVLTWLFHFIYPPRQPASSEQGHTLLVSLPKCILGYSSHFMQLHTCHSITVNFLMKVGTVLGWIMQVPLRKLFGKVRHYDVTSFRHSLY